eukprot:gene35772-53807_t
MKVHVAPARFPRSCDWWRRSTACGGAPCAGMSQWWARVGSDRVFAPAGFVHGTKLTDVVWEARFTPRAEGRVTGAPALRSRVVVTEHIVAHGGRNLTKGMTGTALYYYEDGTNTYIGKGVNSAATYIGFDDPSVAYQWVERQDYASLNYTDAYGTGTRGGVRAGGAWAPIGVPLWPRCDAGYRATNVSVRWVCEEETGEATAAAQLCLPPWACTKGVQPPGYGFITVGFIGSAENSLGVADDQNGICQFNNAVPPYLGGGVKGDWGTYVVTCPADASAAAHCADDGAFRDVDGNGCALWAMRRCGDAMALHGVASPLYHRCPAACGVCGNGTAP